MTKPKKKNKKQQQETAKKINPKRVNRIIYLIIIAYCFVLYGNTIQNDYSLDDNYVIFKNDLVQKGIKGIPEIFTTRYSVGKEQTYGYRPFTKAFFAIEYDIFGSNPHTSHFINILLYSLLCILLFVVLKRIFYRLNSFFSLIVILLFISHPIHTEVVASLKNREEIFSTIFSFSALLCFINAFEKGRWWNILFGVVLFAFGLLSKLSALSFIGIIPLTLFFISNKKESTQKDEIRPDDGRFSFLINPYFIIGAILLIAIVIYGKMFLSPIILLYIISTYIIKNRSFGKGIRAFYKNKYVFVPSVIFITLFLISLLHIFSFMNSKDSKRILVAIITIIPFLIYLSKSLFGNWLIVFSRISRQWYIIAVGVILIGIIGYVIVNGPEKYVGPTDKKLYFFENPQHFENDYLITLEASSRSLLFYMQKLVIPHPLGCYYGYKIFDPTGKINFPVILSIILNLGLLIYSLIRIWKKDPIAWAILFYFATIIMYSNIFIPVNGIVSERFLFMPSLAFCIIVAFLLFKLLKVDIKIQPERKKRSLLIVILMILLIPYTAKTVNRNKDWKDRLTLYLSDVEYLDESAKIHSMISNEAIYQLKLISNKNGLDAEKNRYLQLGEKHARRAVEIFPDFFENWNNLGTVYYIKQDLKNALICLKKANSIRNDNVTINYNIAMNYEKLNQADSSIHYYNRTLELDSSYSKAYSNLARLYYNIHDSLSCYKTIKRSLKNNPTSDLPYLNMGTYHMNISNIDSTVYYFEKAMSINPVNAKVRKYLFDYYTKAGNKEKAALYK